MKRARASLRAALTVAVLLAPGCSSLFHKSQPPVATAGSPAPLPVKKASEEVVVAAWAEPPRLPPGGGQAQILIRLQRRGGAPFEGVEVRLTAAPGTLFSGGRVLVSDGAGQTRDRLTARRTTFLTLNAGGTVYRFKVPVGGDEAPSR